MDGTSFSTAQLREWAGINSETLRHWKDVLPPIAGRDGRSAGYTLSEIAALAVIARLRDDLHVPVARLAIHAEQIFEAVEAFMIDPAAPGFIYIYGEDMAIGTISDLPPIGALAVVRIDVIVSELHARMTALHGSSPQLDLFELA